MPIETAESLIEERLIASVFQQQKKHASVLKTATIAARKEKLRKLERTVLNWQERIEQAVYQDFQKNPTETALTEVYKVISEIRYAAKNLNRWAKPKKVGTPLAFLGTQARVVHEPKGVALIISPWNYPFSLAMCPLISAIAAGNTVMLKPSEYSSHTTSLMKQMLAEVFPPEEVSVFEGGVEVSQALLELPFDHVFFTGSPTVGKIIMEAAAKNLSSVTLELGGKSPALVDEHADLRDTAEKLVWGKLVNGGQTCVAPDYVLVNKNVEQKLLWHIKEQVTSMYGADQKAIKSSTDFSRIITKKHAQRLAGLIEGSLEQGAAIALGGDVNVEERYIAPTVLTQVGMQHRVMQEEIFGPILPVISYERLEDALAIINRLPKPLALYAFSKRQAYLNKITALTTAGTTVFNDVLLQFSHEKLPFGGVNNSGIGKSHGKYGFLAFTNERAVLRQRIGLTGLKLMYPPYNERVKKLVQMLIRWL